MFKLKDLFASGMAAVILMLPLQEAAAKRIGFLFPDLTVEASSITVSPLNIKKGDEIKVKATIVNNSFDRVRRSFQVSFEMKDYKTVTVSGMNPYESKQIEVTYPVLNERDWIGLNNLMVTVDAFDEVMERNENNNVTQKEVVLGNVARVSNYPDLSFKSNSLSYSPQNPEIGDRVTVSAVVMNNSDVEVKIPFQMNFKDAQRNNRISSMMMEKMAAHEERSVQTSFYYNDERQMSLELDSFDNIFESNENNNIAYLTITPALPKADLAVELYQRDSFHIDPLGYVEMSAKVSNLTGTAINKPFNLKFFLVNNQNPDYPNREGEDTQVVRINNFGAYETRDFSAAIQVPEKSLSGWSYYYASVDTEGEIAEKNESNNLSGFNWFYVNEKKIEAPKYSDLAIREMNISPSNPTAGDSVTLRATVENIGDTASTENTITFSTDQGHVQTLILPALNKGEMVQLGVTFVTANSWEGKRIAYAEVNTGRNLIEKDYANNRQSIDFNVYVIRFTLPSPPTPIVPLPPIVPAVTDIAVTDIKFGPEKVLGHSFVKVSVTLENKGNKDIETPFTVRMDYYEANYPDKDQVIKNITVGSLRAGEVMVVETDFFVTADTRNGYAIANVAADYEQNITETDELNNTNGIYIPIEARY